MQQIEETQDESEKTFLHHLLEFHDQTEKLKVHKTSEIL